MSMPAVADLQGLWPPWLNGNPVVLGVLKEGKNKQPDTRGRRVGMGGNGSRVGGD